MRTLSIRILCTLPLLASLALTPWSLWAEHANSLLPFFGGPGYMLNKQSKDNHTITGWLPKRWTDNSTWAAVNAVYTQRSGSRSRSFTPPTRTAKPGSCSS